MGEHRQEQECPLVGHQRGDGARFGGYHPDLSCLAGQHGDRQGKQPDIEISIRGRIVERMEPLFVRVYYLFVREDFNDANIGKILQITL